MISPVHARTMARYNRWQNEGLIAAADTLDEDARRADRGAFWRSIQGTLVHVLWGDATWMARLDGWEIPRAAMKDSAVTVADWEEYKDRRRNADARILEWAAQLKADDLAGDLIWFSGILGREVSKPKWLCVQHFFNHQTHHRGQFHAMLTAAGARPGDTDLFLMPEAA